MFLIRFGPPGDRQFGAAGSLFEVILSLWEVILGAWKGIWATFGVFFGCGEKKLKKNAPFGRPKWPKGVQNGSQKGAKIVPKSIEKSIEISMVVFVALFVDFGAFLMSKWSQSGTKVDTKTDMNAKRPQSLKCYKTQ